MKEDSKKKLAAQNQISPEESKLLESYFIADGIYDAVISEMNIPKNDELYRNLLIGVLKRQTKNHLVFAIWNNIDEKQNKHLRDFINQSSVLAPWLSHEDVMLEFAMMYPELMRNVYMSLTVFFKSFIAKFNEISDAGLENISKI